ncbi:condensation domain-containing protein, partial [Pseudoalteromonas sp. BMB]|uniref:condensation domain-containing protein n=1 Tax=Pseudoalteromonas sp. BMB TaxID=1874619 RepID=UPI0020C799BB
MAALISSAAQQEIPKIVAVPRVTEDGTAVTGFPLREQAFRLTQIDLSHEAEEAERHAQARRICQQEANTAFDLSTGPLIRGQVIKLSAELHILMLNMHHIISDGWSLGVMIKEFSQIMERLRVGKEVNLEPLPIQYVDYSVWQRKYLGEGGILEQQLGYWREKLSGVAETLDLVTDYPRGGVTSTAGARHLFTLDSGLSAQLKRLSEQQGSTLFMTLLAAFNGLLYRYTGQHDICLGSPIANRHYGETEGLIGMFVNTLALRNQVDGEQGFDALLAQV